MTDFEGPAKKSDISEVRYTETWGENPNCKRGREKKVRHTDRFVVLKVCNIDLQNLAGIGHNGSRKHQAQFLVSIIKSQWNLHYKGIRIYDANFGPK